MEQYKEIKMSQINEFNEYRQKMNDRILSQDNKIVKRIFSLDNQTFSAGALDLKTKELLGLVASMVLRCDDCVKYHLETAHKLGTTTDEVFEVLSIANLIGGTICIPHMRRAVEFWDELLAQA